MTLTYAYVLWICATNPCMISCVLAHLTMHIISRAHMHMTPIMHISSRLSIMPICQLCIVEMHMTMAVLLVEIVWPIIVEIVCIWHIIVEIILHSTRLDLLVLIIVEIIIIVNYKDSYYLYILWVLCGFSDQKISLYLTNSDPYATLAKLASDGCISTIF